MPKRPRFHYVCTTKKGVAKRIYFEQEPTGGWKAYNHNNNSPAVRGTFDSTRSLEDYIKYRYPDLRRYDKAVSTTKKPDMLIRPDDEIMILKPFFFIRCGYKTDVSDFVSEFYSPVAKVVTNALGTTNLDMYGRNTRVMCQEMAYIKAHRMGFGGPERKIFETPHIANAKQARAHVEKVNFKKTGTYSPAAPYYQGHEYPVEFEPARLLDEKTHKILTLNQSYFCKKTNKSYYTIRADHCVKITKDFDNANKLFD